MKIALAGRWWLKGECNEGGELLRPRPRRRQSRGRDESRKNWPTEQARAGLRAVREFVSFHFRCLKA